MSKLNKIFLLIVFSLSFSCSGSSDPLTFDDVSGIIAEESKEDWGTIIYK